MFTNNLIKKINIFVGKELEPNIDALPDLFL